MRDTLWPEDESLFEDLFAQADDPDRGRAIEDRYGCVRYGDESGILLLATHYYLPSLGLASDELLRRADPAEYEQLQHRIARRRGDSEHPWLVLVSKLNADDEGALLQGFGVSLEQARARFLDPSLGSVPKPPLALPGRWHRA